MNIDIKARPTYRKSKLPKSKLPVKFQQIKQSACFKSWKFVKSYLGHSNIHGVCYLAKEELTWFERFFWLFLVVLCLTSCILVALQSVDRFNTKSTVVGLESDYCYWNTTLPSLTICPMLRLNEKRIDKLCDMHGITDQRKTEFKDFLEKFANATYATFDQIPAYDSIDQTFNELDIYPENYMELIYNLTEDLTLVANESCRLNCVVGDNRIFVRQVLTEFGLCYLTNTYLGTEYTSRYMIFGERPEIPILDKKRRHMQVQTGMSLHKEVHYAFLGFLDSIGVFIHSAYETMRVDSGFVYTNVGVEFEPSMTEIVADEGLEKSATIAQRKCRFHHESNLAHFPVYTRNMCIQECRLNLAMKLCGCIPHFYPNRIAKPKTVCGYRVLRSCIWRHHDYLLRLYTHKGHKSTNCHCLPNCRDAFVRIMKSGITKSAEILLQSATGSIKVTTWPHNRFKRQMIFSVMDLLVAIGGTAGLFLGFSVLGAVEILYYFTLRLICHLCGHKHN